MDRFSALGELPTLHAVAIRLRDEGVDNRVIAAALAVAPKDVPAFLDIAEAKLARLEASDVTPLPSGDPSEISDGRPWLGDEAGGRGTRNAPHTHTGGPRRGTNTKE